VIYSSVLPVHNYTPRAQELFAQRSPDKILQLNRWLKNYCAAASGCSYLDYFSAMVDEKACSSAGSPMMACTLVVPGISSWPRWPRRRSIMRSRLRNLETLKP